MFMMDCSLVGSIYIMLSLLGGCMGFGFSFQMSGELLYPFMVHGDDIFYVCVTAHAVLMVFFFLTTLATGFANFFIPGMMGVMDFYFPSVNSLTLWLMVVSVLFLVSSLLFGGGVSTGWTAYPPLSSMTYSDGGSIDLFVMAVHMFTLSTLLSSMNTMCTVFYFKPFTLEWMGLSMYVWSMLVTSFLNIFSLPYFSSSVTMLFLDSNFNCVFFDPVYGGDPLLFQSLFWFWGHPEVYMLVMPVFGLMALVMGQLMKLEFLFGNYCMVVSMMSVSVLGFMVWGHHMVTVGWSLDISMFFMVATMVMSLPTGLKVFNWVCSVFFFMLEGSVLEVCCYYVFSFVVMFVFGGSTGMMLANSSLDILFHDSYFVVGHFHYILSLAAVSGYFCLFVYAWCAVSGGGSWDFMLGFFHLSFFFSSANLLFVPFHVLGILGCPSSVACYTESFFVYFYVSSCGFVFVLFSLFLFVLGVLYAVNGEDTDILDMLMCDHSGKSGSFYSFLLSWFDICKCEAYVKYISEVMGLKEGYDAGSKFSFFLYLVSMMVLVFIKLKVYTCVFFFDAMVSMWKEFMALVNGGWKTEKCNNFSYFKEKLLESWGFYFNKVLVWEMGFIKFYPLIIVFSFFFMSVVFNYVGEDLLMCGEDLFGVGICDLSVEVFPMESCSVNKLYFLFVFLFHLGMLTVSMVNGFTLVYGSFACFFMYYFISFVFFIFSFMGFHELSSVLAGVCSVMGFSILVYDIFYNYYYDVFEGESKGSFAGGGSVEPSFWYVFWGGVKLLVYVYEGKYEDWEIKYMSKVDVPKFDSSLSFSFNIVSVLSSSFLWMMFVGFFYFGFDFVLECVFNLFSYFMCFYFLLIIISFFCFVMSLWVMDGKLEDYVVGKNGLYGLDKDMWSLVYHGDFCSVVKFGVKIMSSIFFNHVKQLIHVIISFFMYLYTIHSYVGVNNSNKVSDASGIITVFGEGFDGYVFYFTSAMSIMSSNPDSGTLKVNSMGFDDELIGSHVGMKVLESYESGTDEIFGGDLAKFYGPDYFTFFLFVLCLITGVYSFFVLGEIYSFMFSYFFICLSFYALVYLFLVEWDLIISSSKSKLEKLCFMCVLVFSYLLFMLIVIVLVFLWDYFISGFSVSFLGVALDESLLVCIYIFPVFLFLLYVFFWGLEVPVGIVFVKLPWKILVSFFFYMDYKKSTYGSSGSHLFFVYSYINNLVKSVYTFCYNFLGVVISMLFAFFFGLSPSYNGGLSFELKEEPKAKSKAKVKKANGGVLGHLFVAVADQKSLDAMEDFFKDSSKLKSIIYEQSPAYKEFMKLLGSLGLGDAFPTWGNVELEENEGGALDKTYSLGIPKKYVVSQSYYLDQKGIGTCYYTVSDQASEVGLWFWFIFFNVLFFLYLSKIVVMIYPFVFKFVLIFLLVYIISCYPSYFLELISFFFVSLFAEIVNTVIVILLLFLAVILGFMFLLVFMVLYSVSKGEGPGSLFYAVLNSVILDWFSKCKFITNMISLCIVSCLDFFFSSLMDLLFKALGV